ncbi:GNAT family N-acetyltransferase [Allosphingosinicella indica]|uniref:Protein N-acetyltransferase, RimJ/RimL family n=1 Tax=Allosphingosinicella indica TaxID=941907 RepID=A0A1X7GYQ7_9SPHN|nr:GNAT family N-acetyltransferase [Allosphingosinicella indica]SMF76575.1 Protein N-acetyltransferase, RimJ/RimL family [Allosphingosinicella indica]
MGGGNGVPVLATERLILRAPEAGDLDASAAMWGNEEVVRYVGGKPSTREETWARILRAHGLWSLLGYGYWAVTERVSGRFVGDVGFADFHRAIEPSIDGIPEMGWVLDVWSHGRGYAGEAVAAALQWADEILKAPLTACIIAPENAASIRVADRAGFRRFAAGEYRSAPTLIFHRKWLVA